MGRPTRALALAAALAAATACGDDHAPVADAGAGDADPAAVAARLAATLDALAALGDKRAGSPGGALAGDLLFDRFVEAGLADVRFEAFDFPAYALASSSLSVTLDGADRPMAHDVFYYAGSGAVTADLVDVGRGHPADYAGVDVTGTICLVTRDPRYHRSSQYRECAERGGAAMLYVSGAPDNLIQIGTVTVAAELGPIPVVTVGADDGQAIKDALADGAVGAATIEIDAALEPATGRNVIGALPGADPADGYLLLGAHYDTWYAGAADNGTGVAALLETARLLADRPDRRLGLVFVAYDGEELGLFGGYDYLRDHVFVAGEPMLGFFNFEIPAAGPDDLRALGRTNHAELDDALTATSARQLYTLYVGMEAVVDLFGGLIPTDIQGMYWAGLAGFSTACDTPYYHTTADTPDRIDVAFLADAVLAFVATADVLDAVPTEALTMRDPEVWTLAVEVTPAADGLSAAVTVTGGDGEVVDGAVVTAYVEVDDFTRTLAVEAATDADGRTTLALPAAAVTAGAGSRWLHVLAGPEHPKAEHITALP